MYKIMIVEDDATIAHALAAHLERWDYETRCVEDFKNILGSFAEFDPQLVLLDIMLPFFNGFHWCQEITAKVQAILRRSYSFQGTMNVMEYHGAVLNLNDATLVNNDKKLDLTKNEFRILQMLLENEGRIVSRDSIITRLWESDEFIDDNTLTVNIARLRKKLEQIGLEQMIRTKKGIGYMVER